MSAPTSHRFPVSDRADLILLTHQMNRLPMLQPVTPIDRAIVTTMVSELATNIVKYAGLGVISVTCHDLPDAVDVHIVAQDDGPGIADVKAALADGFSTGDTLGLGLPAVRRMADDFQIDSQPGAGTCVMARKCVRKEHPEGLGGAQAEVGQACRPLPGERLCGDLAVVLRDEQVLWLAMIDGLGHGQPAAEAAEKAAGVLSRRFPDDLNLLEHVHLALQGSVGVVMGLLQVRLDDGSFTYRGVGNTVARRCVGEAWSGLSRDGVLGFRLPGERMQHGRLRTGDVMLMCTDGLSERQARELLASRRDAAARELAVQLVAELAKPHDDAGCIVLKWDGR